MIDDLKFEVYTRLLRFYLQRKDFEKVQFYLDKKKILAKKIREGLAIQK